MEKHCKAQRIQRKTWLLAPIRIHPDLSETLEDASCSQVSTREWWKVVYNIFIDTFSEKEGRIGHTAQSNYAFSDIGVVLGCHRARPHHICRCKGAGLSRWVTRVREGKQSHSSSPINSRMLFWNRQEVHVDVHRWTASAGSVLVRKAAFPQNLTSVVGLVSCKV